MITKAKHLLLCQAMALSACSSPAEAAPPTDRYDASGFCLVTDSVPDAILEVRYYSTYNFIGKRIDGYEQPVVILTKEAASALRKVAEDVGKQGYRLKLFDGYRPQRAVDMFVKWAADLKDTAMKDYFYPELTKGRIIPGGYVARRSGHSRGSTIDLTLFDMATGREVDMGGPFDYFGDLSHPAYPVGGKPGMKPITKKQYEMRQLLRKAMTAHGFKPLRTEWWHFTLKNEPYPNTYFDFPVNENVLKRKAR